MVLLGKENFSPPHSPCQENSDTQLYSTCTASEQGSQSQVHLGSKTPGLGPKNGKHALILSMAAFMAQASTPSDSTYTEKQ